MALQTLRPARPRAYCVLIAPTAHRTAAVRSDFKKILPRLLSPTLEGVRRLHVGDSLVAHQIATAER